VQVTLRHYEDMPHVFFSFVNLIPAGNQAVADVGSRIAELIASAG
jgi:hypothetical protein